MNEGLNLNVLEPTDHSVYDKPNGWIERTRREVDRGMRHFDAKRGSRAMTFRDHIKSDIAEAAARKKARANGRA